MSSTSASSTDEAGEQPGVEAGPAAGPSENGAGAGDTAAAAAADKEKLPPLSPREFRVYNRLAELMDRFHEHFRQSWTLLYDACKAGKRPGNMTLRQFIDEGLQLASYLTMHHNIEETYLFPQLARKMPEFRTGTGKKAGGGGGGNKAPNDEAAELLRQHREIHAGMDHFEEYLRACKRREVEFELPVLRQKMDSWGAVLWKHLDQEVATLGAENMRRYWTVDEINRLAI